MITSLPSEAGAGRQHYIGIFLLAGVTLAYQILITRFFSVVLHYHFAFFGISLAMLGLTRGALMVHRDSVRFAKDRVDAEFARHALYFALTSVAVVIVFLFAPLFVPAAYVAQTLVLMIMLFLFPFIHSGVCITLLLTRLAGEKGKLYAADLAGAATGCMAIVAVMFWIDPFSSLLALGALAALAGWFVGGRSHATLTSGALAIILTLLAIIHAGLYATGSSHVRVLWAKNAAQTDTLFERWNTFSRVRVRPLESTVPFGWGMARDNPEQVQQLYLDIDADAGTVITRLDKGTESLNYLKNDVINSAYLVRPVESVAVIGVGGGRDILSALHFGAKQITGIEINPAIFEVLTDKFADFSGRLHERPEVSLINAEARSYLNQAGKDFDLIQISLIDTWAATAAGGLTLTENRLYTVEAWRDFFDTLSPQGMLSISRWYEPQHHRAEFYRLVAIASEALSQHGIPRSELGQHIVALRVHNIVTVIVSPAPFSQAQWATAEQALTGQGFQIMLGPDRDFDDVTRTLLSGGATAEFFASQPDNIAPSTDNNPFFFYTSRLLDLVTGRGNIEHLPGGGNLALLSLIITLVVTFLAFLAYLCMPLLQKKNIHAGSGLTVPTAYFTLIGLGFMFIEISQMQRLMVFLGHPVYGLSVVLFTLLLFGGIGSSTVQDGSLQPRKIAWRIGMLLAALIVTGVATPYMTSWAKVFSTEVRVLLSVLMLAPLAYFMGMLFPIGIGLCRSSNSGMLSYLWGANGVASVFASVAGVVVSMELGISYAYAIGAACYVLCALTVPVLLKRQTPFPALLHERAGTAV